MHFGILFRCRCSALAALALMYFSALGVRAQETRGSIQGTVTDASGAVVPNAVVTAINLATNVRSKTTTNTEGAYTLSFLLPGNYSLSASAPGFKTSQWENIELRIHDRLLVDLKLEVGAVSERVEVTGQAPLLDTATASMGQVMDARRIAELPTPFGSPVSLVYLTPGVINTYPGGLTYQQPTDIQASITLVNVNGAPQGSTDFTLDGVPNTQTSMADRGVGISNSPPTDMVQEFKIETAMDASVGHTSGAVMNFSLKTGTNTPHGTAYSFLRDPAWNANNFFANRAGQPKGDFTYKRWGATLTGPVYLPKVYNGKDRTFFSYGYEGMHDTELNTFTGTVPEPKQLGGDFSALLALGSNYQIYDPATIQPAANGRFSIQPFPGNMIPTNRISAIGKSIASHYPPPNNAARPDGVNNFTVNNRPEPTLYYNHLARVDHNLSEKQRFYGRVAMSHRNDGPYRNYWDDPAVANNWVGTMRQVAIDDVYSFSPSLIMNIRYGYIRYAGGHYPRKLGYNPSQLGFPSQVVSQLTPVATMFPRVSVAGLPSLGSESADVKNTDTHSVFASFSKQQGAHSFKFGTDIRVYRDNLFGFGNAGGTFSFGTDFTRGPFDNSASSPGSVGQGLAALLLGQPTGGGIDRNDSQAVESTYWSFYFHDNWRATRKLTVDLGLRWEIEGPVTERFNRAVVGFDPNASQRMEAAAKTAYALRPDPVISPDQFRVRGGLLFAGVNGLPRTFWARSWHNFAPRVGFAYQASRRMAVRAGFGTFPIQVGNPGRNNAIQPGFSQTTDLIPTVNNGQTFIADLNNPFPSGVLRAPGASLGVETFLGRSITFYNRQSWTPYSARWNMNTQYLLPSDTLLEVAYVGSKSLRLPTTRDLDYIPNQYLSASPVRDQQTIDFLSANVPNPFAGLLPGTGLNGSTIARSQLLRAYPQFSGVSMVDHQGYSWFHSLQVRMERRFSKGFTAMSSYTFSKTMEATGFLNPGDMVPYKSISGIDRTHALSFSGIMELPFGRGKRFGQNVSRPLDLFLGGWQVGPMWLVNSGEPLGFGNALFIGNIKDIPLPAGQRNIDRWFNTDAGFNKVPAQQLAFNLRTFPPLLAGLRAGTYNSWNISLLKKTRIHERHTFEYRVEFLNAFNHPSAWAPPNTSPTSSAFGRVTGMYALPRVVQMGLKYTF